MNFQPFRVSNDALDDPSELGQRLDDDGYLFLRGFQNADALRDLRLQILQRIDQCSDWVLPGSDLADGRVDASKACTEPHSHYRDVYREVYKLRGVHAIPHDGELLALLDHLVDGRAMPHPQKIVRLWFPHYTHHTTPFHQDFVHFQSNLEVLSVWTPLSDCPMELGPLGVIEGSHKVGKVVDHHFSLGAGGQKVDGPESRGIARCNDFELGDTLIFGCLMVHGALPNLTEDRLRVSLDNRYHRAGLPISEQMLSPHLNANAAWDEVYEEWPADDPLRYYWEREQFERVATDTSFGQRAFDEAMQLAEGGDPHALEAVRTAALTPADAPDPRERTNGELAREVLARAKR